MKVHMYSHDWNESSSQKVLFQNKHCAVYSLHLMVTLKLFLSYVILIFNSVLRWFQDKKVTLFLNFIPSSYYGHPA